MRPNVAPCRTAENGLPRFLQQNHIEQHQHSQHQQNQHRTPNAVWTNHHGSFNGGYSRLQREALPSAGAPHHNNSLPTFAQNLHINNHFHHRISGKLNNARDVHTTFLTVPCSTSAAGNYAKLPVNALNLQRINECAGIPLISTASVHLSPGQRLRVQRKTSSSPPRNQKPDPTPPPDTYKWHMPNYSRVNSLPHLAAHAQGASLLVNKTSTVSSHWTSRPPQPTDTILSRSLRPNFSNYHSDQEYSSAIQGPTNDHNSRKAHPQQYACAKENVMQPRADAAPHSTQQNVTRELSETCLPRIIKPRKRRKKDRKPGSGMFVRLDDFTNTECEPRHCHNNTNQITNSQYLARNQFVSNAGIDIKNNAEITESPLLCVENILTASSPYAKTSTARKHNPHGVCFCEQCDPLRRIWDYPLRRSCSDSSATSTSDQSSTSSSSSSSTSFSSEVQSSAHTRSRAEIVGVIGSNRSNNELTHKSSGQNNHKTNSGCQSDSNDSGFGDIMGGINIAEDFFCSAVTAQSSAIHTTFAETNCSTLLPVFNTSTELRHPATAESLLNESINELSRQLLETCSAASFDFTNVKTSPVDNTSFSHDSGIGSASPNSDEFVFNFDQLSIINDESTKSNLTPLKSDNKLSSNINVNQTNFLFPPTTELLHQLDMNNLINNNKCFTETSEKQSFYNNNFDLWPHTSNDSNLNQKVASTPRLLLDSVPNIEMSMMTAFTH